MKTILGLDLGTNSIGWALVKQDFTNKTGHIEAVGSRIIPMSQDILGNFDKGISISQTAVRTAYRGVRRLRERHLLRRERLHRVLHHLGFLPPHYEQKIDFKNNPGKFVSLEDITIPYKPVEEEGKKKFVFIFQESFQEMLEDFKKGQVIADKKSKIPYDWTLYYLRKKALSHKIEKEELAWILLNFNQKRGYYQLRGEEETTNSNKDKKTELYTLKVTSVTEEEVNSRGLKVYTVNFENGWQDKKTGGDPLAWIGKTKDFIVTTEYEKDGVTPKKDKYGNEKRTFRAPEEDDWNLIKKKTEKEIEKSGETVGEFIYENLIKDPHLKIRGALVRTIERKFYKEELKKILEKQKEFHPELQDATLYKRCIQDLYKQNEAHRNNIATRDFTYLFLEDIIFYQRPLKSKKYLISDCRYEYRTYVKEGVQQKQSLKVIPASHPLYQEFRLWQWIYNVKIWEIQEKKEVEVTQDYFKTEEDYASLFAFLNEKKEIDQKGFLKFFKLKEKEYRWNYVEDKKYPCNETRYLLKSHLSRIEGISEDFLSNDKELLLWHLLYSIKDKEELKKALNTFAVKQQLPEQDFVEVFINFPVFASNYGSYSEKAIKKLLPLMRTGKYWKEEDILPQSLVRIQEIKQRLESINYEADKIKTIADDDISIPILKSFLPNKNPVKRLQTYQACYAVYGRHSEERESLKWNYHSLEEFIKKFKQHSLRNPIVEQVITETLRVVKDIWLQYGNAEENFFDEIHIELGREMKNPADKRKKMTSQNTENENTNLRIRALLTELFNDPEVENVRPHSYSQQQILKIFEEYALTTEESFDKQRGKFVKDPPTEEILKISKMAQPTSNQLNRYKLWLEQRYRSPYTGKPIPLSQLFTSAYQIEHIIPQSRYFDDSLSNKVICEAEVNGDKGNYTAYEYMSKRGGEMVSLNGGGGIPLLSLSEYEKFIEKNYKANRIKKKKLLMEEIPENMIERQLNDTRYISTYIKNLLSNIVREEKEIQTTSKNVISSIGSITATLRKDWGLEDVWNDLVAPRFQRMNTITHSTDFGEINPKTRKFLPTIPLDYSKGFSKKRIDHRHHPLDAVVIACLTREHVNYMNFLNSERKNSALVSRLRKLVEYKGNKVAKEYLKPWDTFTQEVRQKLQSLIVSFKQNTRVINKTVNHYQVWKNGKKIYKRQEKGDSWSIRKPLHKETVYGKVKLKIEKSNPVPISQAIKIPDMIVDSEIRKIVKEKVNFYKENEKGLQKYFKENPIQMNGVKIDKVSIYTWIEATAGRVKLDTSFDLKKIQKITDTGIQSILKKHLERKEYQNQTDGKGGAIPPQELAFSESGIITLNESIKGKHEPIYKVRVFEEGSRFALGETGNKKDKYVEAAKGTNLFFAVYADKEGKRSYESISLNKVIEYQKQGVWEGKKPEDCSVPLFNDKGDALLFYLSPNDLVYILEEGEMENVNLNNLTSEQIKRIYKVVSFAGAQCFFVRHEVANSIVNKMEFSSSNKMEKSIEGIMIKENCIKLNIDRIGKIKK